MRLFLEQYVLLGNYLRDLDRLETLDAFFLEFFARRRADRRRRR